MTGMEKLLHDSRPTVSPDLKHRTGLKEAIRSQFAHETTEDRVLWSVRQSYSVMALALVLLFISIGNWNRNTTDSAVGSIHYADVMPPEMLQGGLRTTTRRSPVDIEIRWVPKSCVYPQIIAGVQYSADVMRKLSAE
jgi:hypothetical protein